MLAFTEEIAKKIPRLQLIRRLRFRIPIAIIITVVPYFLNQEKDAIVDGNTARQKGIDDSITTARSEAKMANLETVHIEREHEISLTQQKQLTELLAKYKLEYDSVNQVLKNLISDSMRALPDPEIDFCPGGLICDSVRRGRYYFKMNVCNYNAPSNNINVKLVCIEERRGAFNQRPDITNENFSLVPYGSSLSTGRILTFSFFLDLMEQKDNWFIYIYGGYTNRSGTKKFKVDKVIQFDIKNRNVKEVMPKEYRLFMKFSKEHIFPDDLYWGP